MCGICGMVSRAPDQGRTSITSMLSALGKRGPDDTAEFTDPHLRLGMTRLSIIDLHSGNQPFHGCRLPATVIVNGEIYNYVELRKGLVSRGHIFRTNSDGEVIVHLYEELGPRCVDVLRGMFAFALWDARRQVVLLARDRMGEKPLYLHQDRDTVVFASEIKALLASGVVPKRLDPTAVHEYFHYQYVPEPRTPLQEVVKLPAGHLMVVHLHPWRVEQRRYWSMTEAPALDGDPVEALRAELRNLGPLITRADVPIGVALSGGLDSSAVATLAAEASSGPVHAFSLGYHGRPANDERTDARALAAMLNLDFHEIELGPRDVVDGFPELVRDWDDPIADMAGFSYRAIARAAADQGVRVLLQGQGGDELFWGYPWVRRSLARSMERLSAARCGRGSNRLQPPLYDLDFDFQEARQRCGGLYEQSFRDEVDRSTSFREFPLPDDPETLAVEVTRLIIETYLCENGIAQGDRLTMASSVELRLPLVDQRVVETTIGFRKRHRDYALKPKAWLRDAMSGLLPEATLRREKRPFSPPLEKWHRCLLEGYGWMLADGALVELGILRSKAAKQLSTESFPVGGGSPLSFKALVLESWCRTTLQLGEIENRS